MELGLGNSLFKNRALNLFPRQGLQVIVYNQTYEEEGTTYLRTSTGVGIPKVSGTGNDTIWDFSVLNDVRFDKSNATYWGSSLDNWFYYDAENPYHCKVTDFHYRYFENQMASDNNFCFAKFIYEDEVLQEVNSIFIYESTLSDRDLTKIKTHIGIQDNFYEGELFPAAGLLLNATERDNLLIKDEISNNDIKILPAYLDQRKDVTTKRFYSQGSEFDIGSNDFTICGWVKVNGDNGNSYQALFGKSPGVNIDGSYGVLFERSASRIMYVVGVDGVIKYEYSSAIVYGDWHFIMIEIDQTNKKIRYYIDNVQIGSDISFMGTFPNLSSRYFAIGVRDYSGNPSANLSYAGYSDVRIYKNLLSVEEKTSLFEKTNEPQAYVHYPLNNNYPVDISGNDLHLTDPFPQRLNDVKYFTKASKSLIDYGYDIYTSKQNESVIYIPHNYNEESIVAGDIPSHYTLYKKIAGISTKYNLADAKLDLIISQFDRSNTTLFNDEARGYLYDVSNPKLWHVSELDNFNLYYVSSVEYNKRNYIKISTNSYNNRITLEKILVYDSERTDADNNQIVKNYCGDGRHPSIVGNKSGVVLTFDDLSRSANWDAAETYLRPLYPNWKATFMLNGNSASYWYMPNLLSKGHEAGNHTVNHIDWKTYLETNTVEDFFNTEVLPQQQTIYNELGVMPTTFGYAQIYGYNDDDLDNFLLSNGFTITRPALHPTNELTVNRFIYYDGSNQVVWCLSIGNFSDDAAGQEKIEELLNFAIKYNLIIMFVGHNIDLTNTTNDFYNVKVSRLEALFDFMNLNGMNFYTCNELLPSVF